MNRDACKGLPGGRGFHKVANPPAGIDRLRRWGIVTTLAAAWWGWTWAYGDEVSLEYRIKAAYIYNFTKFVEWPDRVNRDNENATMTLCVLGYNPFGGALKSLEGKASQDRVLRVEQYVRWEGREVTACQVLFISALEQGRLDVVLEQLQYTSVLTVSDMDNFARRGGMIGFVVKDNKIRLEINLEVARRAGLKIRAKLLEVATVVSSS